MAGSGVVVEGGGLWWQFGAVGTGTGTSHRCGPATSDPGALVSAQCVRGLVSLVSCVWHRVKAAPVPRVSLELPQQAGEEEAAKIYLVSTPSSQLF